MNMKALGFGFLNILLALLSPGHKRVFILLQLLFLVTALIQVAGVASLAPFIALISNPEIITSNIILNTIYEFFSFSNYDSFLLVFAILIMVIILFGNTISAVSTWLLFRFTVDVGAELQNRVYTNYINNDFVFFSSNNSSKLASTITQEIPRFVYMVLQPLLHLISQLFVFIIIMIGLFYIDFILATFCLLIVAGVYFLIFKLLRIRLVDHGAILTKANNQKFKLLNESLEGIKEVKIFDLESWYADQVRENNLKSLSSAAFISLAGDLPRFIVETITFLSILLLALYLLNKHGHTAYVISILSLYAMAGYKLLPAVQTLYKSFSLIKANGGVLKELKFEIESSIPLVSKGLTNNNVIEFDSLAIVLKNVSFKYPKANRKSVDGLSLKIEQNKITSFVGASGSGKSTTVDIILGLLYPDEGEMFIGNKLITRDNIKCWQKNLGYVPQSIFILDDTISSNIAFGCKKGEIDLDLVVKVSKMAHLDDFIDTLPGKYNFVVGERGAQLSGGQKQRIGIARALYHQPKILILDEATSALDSVTESHIMSDIEKISNQITVIMIAHRLTTVINSDKIIFLEHGKVSGQGTFQELKNQNSNFSELVKKGLAKQK